MCKRFSVSCPVLHIHKTLIAKHTFGFTRLTRGIKKKRVLSFYKYYRSYINNPLIDWNDWRIHWQSIKRVCSLVRFLTHVRASWEQYTLCPESQDVVKSPCPYRTWAHEPPLGKRVGFCSLAESLSHTALTTDNKWPFQLSEGLPASLFSTPWGTEWTLDWGYKHNDH